MHETLLDAMRDAVERGDLEDLRLLLEQDTPAKHEFANLLMRAVHRPNAEKVDIAGLLIDHGADVNRPMNLLGLPLCMAAKHPDSRMVALLLERGANPNGETGRRARMPPLMEASSVTTASLENVKLLLEYGVDINQVTSTGDTALICAAGNNKAESATQIVETLLEHGADVNATDIGGDTALIKGAALQRRPDIARLLLAHGADKGVTNRSGMDALSYANKNGHRDTAELLRSSRQPERLSNAKIVGGVIIFFVGLVTIWFSWYGR